MGRTCFSEPTRMSTRSKPLFQLKRWSATCEDLRQQWPKPTWHLIVTNLSGFTFPPIHNYFNTKNPTVFGAKRHNYSRKPFFFPLRRSPSSVSLIRLVLTFVLQSWSLTLFLALRDNTKLQTQVVELCHRKSFAVILEDYSSVNT